MDSSGNDLMRMIFNINESMQELNTHNLFEEIEEEDNYVSSFNIPPRREIENQFFTNMMQLVAGNLSNNGSNLNNIPNLNNISNILQESFNQKNKYKKITSEKGLNKLIKIIYNETYDQKDCPIYMTKFQIGEEITQLPCNHLFSSIAIEKWLKEEQHMCPVCRYELDYDEIKIKNFTPLRNTPLRNTVIEEVSDLSNNDLSNSDLFNSDLFNSDLSNSDLSNNIFHNMTNSGFLNLLFPTLPESNIEPIFNNLFDHESEINMDRQLQQAIMDSLNEDSLNRNNSNSE